MLAFEKVSLRNDIKNYQGNSANIPSKNSGTETDVKRQTGTNDKQSTVRCFNCSKMGHMSSNCRLPKRPPGGCFKCFELGHQSKDCPKKTTHQKGYNQISNLSKHESTEQSEEQINCVSANLEIHEISEDSIDNQCFRTISYEFIDNMENPCVMLNTLLDAGSPISFVKKSLVPESIIETFAPESSWKYCGTGLPH